MARLRAKLKSQAGASLLIALVFFLLCLTVGTIVLTASGASAGRLAGLRADEQAYLTVSSAARLLRDGLEGARFTRSVITVTADGVPQGEPETADSLEGAALLAARLREDAAALLASPEAAPSGRFTVEAEGLEPVDVRYTMAADGGLRFALSLADGGSPMVLTVPAQRTDDADAASRDVSVPTGEKDGDGNTLYTVYTETTTTETTTLIWGRGLIEKGAQP